MQERAVREVEEGKRKRGSMVEMGSSKEREVDGNGE